MRVLSYLVDLFATFRGRIRRRDWWIGFLIVLVLGAVGAGLLNNPYKPQWKPALADTLWHLLMVVPLTAITVKRLNDRDWPNWLGYSYGFVIADFAIARYFGLAVNPFKASPSEQILYAPYFLFSLFIFIDNGFLRGSDGPNRYGPDPLAQTRGDGQP